MPGTKHSIGFIINSVEYGGAQRVFVDDANSLAALGYEATFFVLYGDASEYPLADDLSRAIDVIYLHARSAFDRSAVHRCVQEVRTKNIRVLMSTLNDGNIFARWVALGSGGAARLLSREANTLVSKTFFQKVLDIVFAGVPYRILAVSEEVRNSLLRLLPFSKEKILLLPNAVTLPPEIRRVAGSTPRILTVGRLTEQKDYATLISALGKVHKHGDAFSAVFVGEGWLRPQLEQQVREEGVAKEVEFKGHLPHNAVVEEYQRADLFVSSSRWEGSPNVLLEAMSYSLPVVATAVGGVTDIVQEGRDGLLVPPHNAKALADAILRLLGDAALRERLGAAARERVGTTFSRATRLKELQALIGAA